MYSVDELGCDNSAIMRVTAYFNGNFVGTNIKVAANPDTWPVDTLKCSYSQGFDSVVVHYDSPPLTCQDYGVIFMSDNTRVTQLNATYVSEIKFPKVFALSQNYPNPFNPSTTINYQLPENTFVTLKVYNVLGKEIAELVREEKSPGYYSINFEASQLANGVYVFQLRAKDFISSKKMILLK